MGYDQRWVGTDKEIFDHAEQVVKGMELLKLMEREGEVWMKVDHFWRGHHCSNIPGPVFIQLLVLILDVLFMFGMGGTLLWWMLFEVRISGNRRPSVEKSWVPPSRLSRLSADEDRADREERRTKEAHPTDWQDEIHYAITGTRIAQEAA